MKRSKTQCNIIELVDGKLLSLATVILADEELIVNGFALEKLSSTSKMQDNTFPEEFSV